MKKLKIFIIILLCLMLIPIIINFYVVFKVKNQIIDINEINKNYDFALVLGCGVKSDGSPSLMLRDRLDKVIEIYNKGLINTIIISGHHSKSYSEVDVMEEYLLEHNINKDVIIRDNKGFSTSESIENYQKQYKNKSVIIITQEYHLYRSLYLAQKLKLNAVGMPAKMVNYGGQIFRNLREILARNKDFLKYLSK